MGRRAQAVTTEKRQQALNSVMAGFTQKDTGKALGISQPAVSQLLSDQECKQIIDGEHRKLVRLAPEFQERFIALTKSENEKVRLDALKRVQDIIGIAPTHTPSHFLQQIFIQGDNGLQDAAFRELAMRFIGLPAGDIDPSIIDVTPTNTPTEPNRDSDNKV